MFQRVKQFINRWLDTGSDAYAYTGGGTSARMVRAGQQTLAGPLINEVTALSIPAFFHAIRLYGQILGSLDWDLMQFSGSNRNVARDHPVHRLIHDEPNEYQLASSWRETMIGHAITYGNAYSYIERNGNMRPTALQPLLPDRTWPERVDGRLQYVTIINGQRKVLEAYQVFHLPGFSMNALSGIPLVKIMAQTLGLSKSEEDYAAAFFGNGVNTGGFLSTPGKLSDAARLNLTNSFNDRSGNGNAFSWPLLEEGLTATHIEIDAEKTQIIAARQFQLGDLARVVGLVPHLLYDLSHSTNNNIEQQGIEAVTYCFKPWANKLCQEANRKLLYESEKGIFATSIDMKPLMLGDSKTQAERNQILFNCASKTPNAIRADNGENPIEGGDQLFLNTATLPLNLVVQRTLSAMAVAEAAAKATAAPIEPEDDAEIEAAENVGVDLAAQPATDDAPPASTADVIDDGPTVDGKLVEDANVIGVARQLPLHQPQQLATAAILKPVVTDTVSRICRREAKAVGNAYGKHAGDSAGFSRWLAGYVVEARQHAADSLGAVCQTIASFTGKPLDVDSISQRFVDRTKSELDKVAGSDDFELMIEGWKGSRIEELVSDLLGANNEV